MLYIDLKYTKLLSSKLSRFTQLDQHRFRCRCPYCGDSKKSESKARGNIFSHGNNLIFKCFNCGISTSLYNFIEKVDSSLLREYILEKYRDNNESIPIFKKEEIVLLKDATLDDLICITELESDHLAIKYVNSRMIPADKWDRIYYTDTFKQWVNSLFPNKLKSCEEHPRLVFPYFNKHGKVFAANSRSFSDNINPKYLIIKFDNSYDTVYGLDLINWSRYIYVVEGQIDSLFIPNCLAVSGSSFDIDTVQKIKSNCTLVMDNEPRNKEVSKLIYKYIERGYNICLFPETFKFKDINDAIIGGMSSDEIMKIISKNTFSGLTARVKFLEWRK